MSLVLGPSSLLKTTEGERVMKYKVGDKVRIVSCEYGHGFNLGDIVKISKVGVMDLRILCQ